MKYALNLSCDLRILSACVVLPHGNYNNMSIVDSLPDGDISNYRYIDNQYVYDPIYLPDYDEEDPTTSDILDALLGV